MSVKTKQVPEGWSPSQFNDFCLTITKGSTPTSYGFKYQSEGIKFIKTENIDSSGKINGVSDYIDEGANNFLKRSILVEDDLLFSIAGTIGRTGIVLKDNLPANTNQALAIIRCPWDLLNNKFIFYFLKSPLIQTQALKSIVGVGRANISLTNIKEFNILLPPLLEQERIVSKIEELFTKLDAGIEELEEAKKQIKRYRQSVLKNAFTGKLSEKCRDEHNLTSEWGITTVAKKFNIVGGGTPSTKVKEYWKGKIPWITSADIHGTKDIKPRNHITKKAISESATNLVPENSLIVVTRVGLGKIAIAPYPICFSQDCQALIYNPSINPYYALYYLSMAVQIFKYQGRGTTISGVTKKQLAELSFPLPEYKEQTYIVSQIERQFSIADKADYAIDQSLKQAEQLRQSILKKAFEGRLVPQNPNDEPASVMLERIKAEKEKLKVKNKTIKQTRKRSK